MSAGAPRASRDELVHPYDTGRTASKDELSSAYQYLSFYIGLIGAILGQPLPGSSGWTETIGEGWPCWRGR